ncbi:MAG: leucyl aminopeptidase [Myxococcota bacterium]
MHVVPFNGEPLSAATDLLAIAVFSDDPGKGSLMKALDRALGGAIVTAIEDEEFKGKSEQRLQMVTMGKLRAKRVALLGLGAKKSLGPSGLMALGGQTTRLGNAVSAKHVTLVLPKELPTGIDAHGLIARGAALGAYRFTRYLSDKGRKQTVQTIAIASADSKHGVDKRAVARGLVVSEAVALARDLVNEPPQELYPATFAKLAAAEAKKHGIDAKIYDEAQLAKMDMNLLLAVGNGSDRKPRLVHLSYTPKKAKKGPTVLVGKGVTFDSGGLCIKPPSSMDEMKDDMGGAATVLATMIAAAALELPIELHGVLAMAENMPSGTAFRNGDVIKSAMGRTVEINNTDAEGRLVLADAIHYAKSLKPKRIIDLATLTGACVVALGPYTTGVFSNDDDMADRLLDASRRAGEDAWRMPLNPLLKEQLKSDIADTKNTGDRFGGAITAALFLSEFVGDVPWCHLDIAGPIWSKKDSGAMSKGGTGVMVATLIEMLS